MGAFDKITPGGTLPGIPAELWNAMIDCVNDFRSRGDTRGAGQGRVLGPGEVFVRNDTGGACARYEVVAISGIVIDSTASATTWMNNVVFKGIVPTATAYQDSFAKFLVLQEPIANGSIGVARIAGTTPVKVFVHSTNHRWATFRAGSLAQLNTSYMGSARILWQESGTGSEKWAVVDLGCNETPLRYLKLTENWNAPNGVQGGQFNLVGNPCKTISGGTVDTGVSLTVYAQYSTSRRTSKAPNAITNDVVSYAAGEDGVLICTSIDIWDDVPGTRKWIDLTDPTTPTVPRGWALCNGTANSSGNGGSGVDLRKKFIRVSNDGTEDGPDPIQLLIDDHDQYTVGGATKAHVTSVVAEGDTENGVNGAGETVQDILDYWDVVLIERLDDSN